MKTKAGVRKLPDGVNRPAIFNMRKFLREYPSQALTGIREWSQVAPLAAETVLELMETGFAKKSDLRLKGSLREKIMTLQKCYLELVKVASQGATRAPYLRQLIERASEMNRSGRITGNGSEYIVEAVTKALRRGVSNREVQEAIDLFVASQAPRSTLRSRGLRPASLGSPAGQLYQELLNICLEFEEDI
jgi:hypothetical protein